MVHIRVYPEIGLRQTQRRGGFPDADVQAQMPDRGGYFIQLPAVALLAGDCCGEQAPEGVVDARIADHYRGVDLGAVGHAHAAGAAVLNQDLVDLGIGEHLAATVLDYRDDSLGHPGRPANGVVRPVQVMPGDETVDDKAGLFRRYPAVAPLPGQHGLQHLVVGELAEHLVGGAVEVIRQQRFPGQFEQPGGGGGQQLLDTERVDGLADHRDALHIRVDRRLFPRKARLERLDVGLLAGQHVKALLAEKEAVVIVVHGSPLQLAVCYKVIQPAGHTPAAADIAYVMHSHVPLVTITAVTVGKAPGGIMLFQHQHFLTHF